MEDNNMSTNERAKVLTVEEAGRWLGIGRSAPDEGSQRKELPILRVGRRIVEPIEAVEWPREAGRSDPNSDTAESPVVADENSHRIGTTQQ